MSDDNTQPTDQTQTATNGTAELAAAQEEIAKLTEIAKRAMADLANYRRRVEDERGKFAQFANVSLILEILPTIDNFSRAFAHMPENLKNDDWIKGVMAIEKQLVEVLKKSGVSEMPSSVGQPLNPNKHEAIMTAPGEKDTVIEELEKGYLLGDSVLRPAKVKVGDGELSS
ncbi:MAG: nucleotide exchange factor GrpE [Patescibacteria group bacterium]